MLLRPAEPADAIAVARVHVRSWQTAYRTLLPDDYLDQLRPEDATQGYDFSDPEPLRRRTIGATEDGLIFGFVTTAPAREPDLPDHGELCALHVVPEQWGRGMGLALVSAARARLLELGFRKAVLWVLAGNVRADRFYRIDGWEPDGLQRTDSVWGVTVNEIRYRRGLLKTRPLHHGGTEARRRTKNKWVLFEPLTPGCIQKTGPEYFGGLSPAEK